MDLGDKDCAIIIRENMDIELVVPKPSGDMNEMSPHNAIVVAALSVAINDKAVMEMLYDRMEAMLEEMPDDKVSGTEH